MLHLIPCVRGKATYRPTERYQDERVLFDDIVEAYRGAARVFYDRGCRYLQFDDTSWASSAMRPSARRTPPRASTLTRLRATYVDANDRILEVKPADTTISRCTFARGNFRSTWFSSGGDGAGGRGAVRRRELRRVLPGVRFRPLGRLRTACAHQGPEAALGLITSKFPELENEDDVIARIHEAAQYVPLEQLRLSTQCGFSSTRKATC